MADRNKKLEDARETIRQTPQFEDDDDDEDVKLASAAAALAMVAASQIQTPDDVVRRGIHIACNSDSSQAQIVDKWKREHHWEDQQQQQQQHPQATTATTRTTITNSLWSSVVRARVDQYTPSTSSSSGSLPASPPRQQHQGDEQQQEQEPQLPAEQQQNEDNDNDQDIQKAIRMALAVASNPNLGPQEIRRVAVEVAANDHDDHAPLLPSSRPKKNGNNNSMSPERKITLSTSIDMDMDIMDNDSTKTTNTSEGMMIATPQAPPLTPPSLLLLTKKHVIWRSCTSWWWTFFQNNKKGMTILGGLLIINMALLDCYISLNNFGRTWVIVNVTCLFLLTTTTTTTTTTSTTKRDAQMIRIDRQTTETAATTTPVVGIVSENRSTISKIDVNDKLQAKDASIVTTTTSFDDNDNDIDDDDIDDDNVELKTLRVWHPEATEQECRRFLKARGGDVDGASTQLGSYLSWRASLLRGLEGVDDRIDDDDDNDNDDNTAWQRACDSAIQTTTDPTNSSSTATNTSSISSSIPNKLPCLVHFYKDHHTTGGDNQKNKEQKQQQQGVSNNNNNNDDVTHMISSNGTRIIHVLPAQLDPRKATPATYALAVAIYLDLTLDRRSMEKITVVLDVRAGSGWANPSPISLLPFIKIVASLLNQHFPERLSRLVLFPLPFAATFLFNTAKKQFLDDDTAGKICVCGGAGNANSPVPDQVGLYFKEDVIHIMETRRLSLFG